MLVIGGLCEAAGDATARLESALADGRAAEAFGRMVSGLGGPGDILERPLEHLPRVPETRIVEAERPGFVTGIATREIGLAVIGLGGGRTRPQDGIDPAVGFSALVRPGDEVGPGRPLGVVHARDARTAEVAAAALRAACRIGEDAPAATEAVVERID